MTSVGSQKEVKSKSGSLIQVLMPCRTPRCYRYSTIFWVPAGSKSNPKPYEVFAVVNQFVHFKVYVVV